MTGWLIYDSNQYKINSWFADELIRNSKILGIELRLVLAEDLRFGTGFFINGNAADLPDFAVNRTIFPLLSQSLERTGVRVFNCAEISRICNDKRLTYEKFIGTDVPVLPTFFFDRRFLPDDLSRLTEFPAVLKSAAGHGGSEVFLIEDKESLGSAIKSLPDHAFLLQKVCPTVGRDLRVYVLGGKIIGSVLRSSDKSWKSNFSLGGRVEKYEPSDTETDLVNRVIDIIGLPLDFVGIDFLCDRDGLIFNEIEDVVGSRMLYKTYGIDVAREFMGYINSVLR